jgi:hypothetical protein
MVGLTSGHIGSVLRCFGSPATEDLNDAARASGGKVISGSADARRVRAELLRVDPDGCARVAHQGAHLLNGPSAAIGVDDEGRVGVERDLAAGF